MSRQGSQRGRQIVGTLSRLGMLLLSAAILVAGCARFGGGAESQALGYPSDADQYYEDSGAEIAAEPAPAPRSEAGGAVSRSQAPPGMDDESSVSGEAEAATPAERLRVFTGDLTLSVPRVDDTRQDIISIAEESGGYVERSSADLVVVRVPAARFFEVFAVLEDLGEVEHRSVQTADVTDQFTDIERRLEIATRARDRLYELLERTQDADERVAILREIRRLTEEVERLQSALDSLAELIQYSRITVRLVSRIEAEQVLRDRIPFAWIAALDPLVQTLGPADRNLGLTVPDAFAAFSDEKLVSAEAADGARLRVGARENSPDGDAGFWADALSFHLEPFYRSASEFSAGEFHGVIFESKDRDPFYYLVAVTVRGDELLVAEGFFPDEPSLERHRDVVSGMLAGEGVR